MKPGDMILYSRSNTSHDVTSIFKIIGPYTSLGSNYTAECVSGLHDRLPSSGGYWNIYPDRACYVGIISAPVSKLERIIYGIKDDIKI